MVYVWYMFITWIVATILTYPRFSTASDEGENIATCFDAELQTRKMAVVSNLPSLP